MPLILTKKIPAQIKTVSFLWCKREWLLFSEYLDSRRSMNMPITTECQWCKRPFATYDTLAIACPVKGKNMLLCEDCGDDLISSES